MGLFGNKKKDVNQDERERLDGEMRDNLSKAYDELMSSDRNDQPEYNTPPMPDMTVPMADSKDMPLFMSKLTEFANNKTDELLRELLSMLPGRVFNMPSVSNMEQPLENVNGEIRIKKGALINPALLTAQNKQTYVPIFTDEKSMVQKSPSGIVLKVKFDQCLAMVYNKDSKVAGIVINPFTENFILSEDLLRKAYKRIDKDGNEVQ